MSELVAERAPKDPETHAKEERAEASLAPARTQAHPYTDDCCLPPSVASVQAERRLYRVAERIHALGPRPLYELFAELIALHPEFADRLVVFARIDGDFVRAVGGDVLRFELEFVPGEIGGTT